MKIFIRYSHTHMHTLITLKLSELSQSGHTDVSNMPIKKQNLTSPLKSPIMSFLVTPPRVTYILYSNSIKYIFVSVCFI